MKMRAAFLPELLTSNAKAGFSRRVFLAAPFALGGLWLLIRSPSRAAPDPSANGTGEPVKLTMVDAQARVIGRATLRQIVKTDAEWRAQLAQEAFAVTRRGATEFAFANRWWNNHRTGLYRCVCCGTALFRSQQKFDSGTGWPSFTSPLSVDNVLTRPDHTLAELRTEVLCRKCNAHLGHVFDDGPPPAGLRYCMNSAALTFAEVKTVT